MTQSWNYKTDSAKNSEGSIMKFYKNDKYNSVNTYLVLNQDLNFIYIPDILSSGMVFVSLFRSIMGKY